MSEITGDVPRAHTVATGEAGQLSQEQIEHILSLLKPQLSSSTGNPSSSSAPSGKKSLTLTPEFDTWILDSGATNHMTNSSLSFITYQPISTHNKVKVADGNFVSIADQGHIKLSIKLTLKSVVHVPKIACNLLSIPKLTTESNCAVIFNSTHCLIQDLSSGEVIGSARMKEGLYYLEVAPLCDEKVQGMTCKRSSSLRSKIMLLHCRLGHPSFQYIKYLFPRLFWKISVSDLQCDSCQLAKNNHSTFIPKTYRPSRPFYLIHSDVWGPSKISTLTGKRWFVTFIDDHTRMCWLYLLKHKSEVSLVFQNFYHMISTQFQTQIAVLHTDNGTEFFNSDLNMFLTSKGIIHQSSCRDTPQQNGVAERKNRHLLEVTRALMFSSNIPKYLWGHALLTAAYLINRVPSKVLKFKTPLQVFQTSFPYSRITSDLPLKIFGCTCFVLTPPQFRSKLDPRSEKCIFVGYSPTQKGYKCFNPITKRLFVSMNVVFWENQPFYPKISLQGERLPISEGNFWEIDQTLPVILPNINFQLRNPGDNEETKILPRTECELQEKVAAEITNPGLQVYTRRKPIQVQRAPESASLPPSPPQSPGNEGPTPSAPSIPTIDLSDSPGITHSDLPIALRKGTRTCTRYPLSNYLSYAKLSTPHKTFVSRVSNLFVPKTIREALEDTNWSAAVNEEMRALISNGTWKIVTLPKGSDAEGIDQVKAKLAAEFEVKDLGILKYFLGMEFARSTNGLVVNQRKYILDLLRDTGLTGCKPAETPMEANEKLRQSTGEEVKDKERYQRLVGRLIYLTHTRPDIAFAVSVVNQFMHAPEPIHFEAVYRIIRYLKGSPGKGLFF
ncbi:Retrovirus-related Pol polyprotein from transposon RE1, partial [Linum perenne]